MKNEEENIYNLLSDDLKEVFDVTTHIKNVLKEATEKISKLQSKYPDSGIGDTDTDEEIASDLYNMLHWMTNELKDSTNKQNPEETS
jgi:hypothetical protein